MHERLQSLYHNEVCTCPYCKQPTVNLSSKPDENKALNAAEKALLHLHKKGKYNPKDLTQKPYKDLINATKEAFDPVLKDAILPDAMRKSLEEDIFVFSALKSHAQLFEASRLLLDDRRQKKPFQSFAQDVEKIKKDYNQNYLEAEYRFATSSVTMASKWADFEQDGDRYHLQYRTAGDDKVRASHAVLNLITLPINHDFWSKYFAPNGWRCRCQVVQVLKSKYEMSDADHAMRAGEQATTELDKNGNNKLAIFRFNPGKDKVLFPPEHPYRKVVGAKEALAALEIKDKDAASDSRIAMQRKVYDKPLENQYSKIYNDHKSGGSVKVHELVDVNGEDYRDVVGAAKAFAKQGKTVEVLPKVYHSETEARAKILSGYTNKTTNPDLKVENTYMDVKRPESYDSIVHNAIKASKKQNCEAIISDRHITMTDEIIKEKSEAIFNNKDYKQDAIHFIKKGKSITINRTGDK